MVQDTFEKITSNTVALSPISNPPVEIRSIQAWFVCIGFSLSISLAVSNVLIIIMLLYLSVRHFPAMKEQLQSKTFIILISAACIFQVIGIIHDGWLVTKAARIFLLFSFTLLIGNILHSLNIRWLPWFLSSLIIGLIIGTVLNQYFRPEYPLWATYSMKYANQAAGLALTIGLLSYATQKNWLFILLLSGSLFYTSMAGERSDLFSLAAAFIALLFIRYKHKMLLALPLIVVGVGLITITVTPNTQMEKITTEYLKNNARFDIWTHGFLIAQQDAFLGRGEEHSFTAEERTIVTDLNYGGQTYFSNAFPKGLSEAAYEAIRLCYHNQAVQYLVEYGLFGFLIFIMLLIYPFVLAWRRDEYNRTFATGIIIWSAFAMHCLFETSFDNHTVIIIGLLSGLTQIFPDQSSPGQV